MEQEHPIPQQISAYQFRLVGDMTLKQFFQVAGGALLSLLIYASTIPTYFKWPLIIFTFLAGVAFAFFPLQDRPLSTWLVLFIKAIYSPTLYVWKRGAKTRKYFQPEVGDEDVVKMPQQAAGEDVAPAHSLEEQFPELEKKEKEFLSKVTKQLAGTETAVQQVQQTSQEQKEEQVFRSPQRGEKVEVPKQAPPKIEQTEKEIFAADEAPQQQAASDVSELTPMAGEVSQGAKQAKFSDDAAPPMPPTTPNVIVGQVIAPDGGIIESAILEIKDKNGRPVRALRSNKLGHFMIVTPLENGKYEITIEKEGYEFEPVTIEAAGEIIPPIAIWAGGKTEVQN